MNRYRNKMRYTSLVIIMLLFLSSIKAQQNTETYFDPLTDDIAEVLPPLEALLTAAINNSPEVLYEELKTDYYRYETKSAQNAWLEHFGVETELNYGQWYFNDRDELTKLERFYLTQSHRWNFSFGFAMRFPLTSIIDRRNRINKQKKWVEISMAQREINIKQLRKEVITLYNALVQQQRMLKIANDYQHWTYIQMQMAQNEFVSGQISTAEITRLKEIQTRGALEFEKNRAEFENSYDFLQELVGMNFNEIKELK